MGYPALGNLHMVASWWCTRILLYLARCNTGYGCISHAAGGWIQLFPRPKSCLHGRQKMLNSVLAARQGQCSAESWKTFACSDALQVTLSKAHSCRHAPLSPQTTHLIAFSRTFNVFLKGSNARFCARCGSANRVFSAREWGLAEEAGKVWKNLENCHGEDCEDCEDCHQNHQIMGIMVKPWILGQALQEAPTAQGDTSEMSNVWRTISIDCRLVDVASLQV